MLWFGAFDHRARALTSTITSRQRESAQILRFALLPRPSHRHAKVFQGPGAAAQPALAAQRGTLANRNGAPP